MPIPTFTSGYPPDGSSLGQTKTAIRNNLDGEFQVFSVDHENQNTPDGFPAGVHKQSTYQNLGTDPTTVSGQMAVYSRAVTGGSALFSIRDGVAGTKTQLTSAAFNTPLVGVTDSAPGYTYLPGGLILQWGAKSSPGSSGTITFSATNIAFPNRLFSVQLTLARPNTSGSSGIIVIDSGATFDKTQFSYISSSAGSASLYWIAIGN